MSGPKNATPSWRGCCAHKANVLAYIACGVFVILPAPQGEKLCRRDTVQTNMIAFGRESSPAVGDPTVPASAYFTDVVKWASVRNITSGLTATTFDPTSPCPRPRIVTFPHRPLGK